MGNKANRLGAEAQAQRLEGLIRARGDYAHIEVRALGGHLVVQAQEQGEARRIARLTPVGGGLYGLSFCNHRGRWEPMPFSGTTAQLAEDLISALGVYLQRLDFSDPTSGMGH